MIRRLVVLLCLFFISESCCYAYVNAPTGLELERNAWGFIVKRVLPNSPASKNNLLDGDYILEVNNEEVRYMTLNDFCYLFNKRTQNPVTLTVQRLDEVFSVYLIPQNEWQNYTDSISNKILNSLTSIKLPSVFSAEYKVFVSKNKTDYKLLNLKSSSDDIIPLNSDELSKIVTTSVQDFKVLPENSDEVTLNIKINRDGINDFVNLSIDSYYKIPDFNFVDNLSTTSSFIDVLNKLQTHKEVKSIYMNCVYNGLVPVNSDPENKVNICTNLKGITKPEIIGDLLDKTEKKYEINKKSYMNKYAEVKQIITCPEILIKASPFSFIGRLFEIEYIFKKSNGFYYEYPNKVFITPNNTVYSYYLSSIKLTPTEPCIDNAETFSNHLFLILKNKYPDIKLEKLTKDNSISHTDCYQIKGKSTIIEVVPDNSKYCLVFYNMLDINKLNQDYYNFLERSYQLGKEDTIVLEDSEKRNEE